jgi:hypothetical protein
MISANGLYVVPAAATLNGFADHSRAGLALASVPEGTSIVVRTLHSRYLLTVVDGAASKVIVRGGQRFATPTAARLLGSTAGGTAVRLGWIGFGLKMEIAVGRDTTVTSPVESISIGQRRRDRAAVVRDIRNG